jgi:hypothetical protein
MCVRDGQGGSLKAALGVQTAYSEYQSTVHWQKPSARDWLEVDSNCDPNIKLDILLSQAAVTARGGGRGLGGSGSWRGAETRSRLHDGAIVYAKA